MKAVFDRIVRPIPLAVMSASLVVMALGIGCSTVESTGEAIGSAGSSAGRGLSGASNAIGDAGSAVAEGAGGIVSGTGEAIENGARKTARRGY